MLISLFITYMEIQFVQKVDLKCKSYEEFLVENIIGVALKKNDFLKTKFILSSSTNF